MNGIIYVDKPEGWTSFDVVAKVRGIVKKAMRQQFAAQKSELPTGNTMPKRRVKVGHTGTLDPAATGLLVICIGRYTKKVPELIKQDKTYEVELWLGRESTTGDKDGDISASTQGNAHTEPEPAEINDVLKSFVGEQQQTPPAFSAVKVNGKRAYDLARAGKPVKIEPRTVHIHSITDVTYDYPLVRFTTRVGSGTYIRSLVEDIGTSLQTGAYMSNLRRTSIGDVGLDQAVSISDITEEYLLQSCQE